MATEPHNPDVETQQLRRKVAELEAVQASQQEVIDELRRSTEHSEARFRNIFDYSNDAILLLDPDVNAHGRVIVKVRIDEELSLRVSDDGVGLPEELDVAASLG